MVKLSKNVDFTFNFRIGLFLIVVNSACITKKIFLQFIDLKKVTPNASQWFSFKNKIVVINNVFYNLFIRIFNSLCWREYDKSCINCTKCLLTMNLR